MTKKFLTLEEAFALPIDDSPFDEFEYNGLNFEVYKEYDIRIDRLEYTLIVRHPHLPMKLRHDIAEHITREELKNNPPTKFPEHLKEESWFHIIWDLVEAYSLMHGANTNRYQWYTEYRDKGRLDKDKEPWQFKGNEFWPVLTKESVKAYYERKGIKPFLNFDGSRNPEVAY